MKKARQVMLDLGPQGAVCGCCKKPLSDPASVRRGMGPVCWSHEGGGSTLHVFHESGTHSDIDVSFDALHGIFHIFDLDLGGTTVTNAMGPDFQRSILRLYGFSHTPAAYGWTCYGSDGVIATYTEGVWRIAKDDGIEIHELYAARSVLRWKRPRR